MKGTILSGVLAASLLLTGCASMLTREYGSVEPHSATLVSEGDANTLRAESYQDVVNGLIYFINRGAESGSIRFDGEEPDVRALLDEACLEVVQEDPLGAYAVEYIKYNVAPIVGSYEADDFKDISHYALIRLAKFYGVTADYLLGLSEMKNHPNADLADLRLSDEMIDLLKSGRIDNTLLCELAAHPDFPRLMADLEIYVNGTALKQAQGANAIVDTMSATVIKKHNPGMSDTQLRQLITAHIDEDEFCRYVIQRDINGIALALRETHKDDFFSVPEDNPLKEMLETAGEIVSQDSDTEQAYLAFICKRLKLNFRKLSVEERKWLKKIAEKSDLLKNPKPQRGRR